MATIKRKVKKTVYEGNVYIQATFNNTIVTVTDLNGNAVSWASAGGLGFRGAKKSTPYAAQVTAEKAAKAAMDSGLQEVNVFVKGPGVGRESAIRTLGVLGLKVRSIRDVTPIPHNGCRPRKSRRV
ncbi:30S ribosomal protein S11 [Sphaerochaeta halotolerans]|jgi:small subunit ribosomal protein S11|uniref:Small ribosomal subunit protein uS11 n=1 Tax=Sphaerochaeta halotolerans TaxID=2293840 RepID=A0A372MI96_9SPIR|nr:30S ribosomal protein S11 [Sphaerochaeta halotolerans]MBG0766018.1 30S ribosomal protein S11 [Spirochaetaceae bacterium]MDK2858919.1 small subunit ribosomal protein [Sphaerochaeta sp.]MDN5333022.1 small subunit ribosomal protein [Sphaerochaeta sp.]MXI87136.1 30S ribosomal protein S11 [Sphaerochaeta halotolerans]RFU95507.1 30S ribosomal protein S11 [Sphaerochaeta halotolerans]